MPLITEELKEKRDKVNELSGSVSSTGDSIVIKKTEFDDLMNRLNRLEYAANKSNLATFDDKNQEGFGKEVFVRFYDGKAVVGWSQMVNNICEKSPHTGMYQEKLDMKIKFENGKELELPYVTFVKNSTMEKCEVLEENYNKKSNETVLKVKNIETGKKYEINSLFIN